MKEFEFELTFCSPPLHGRAQSERVREWVDFHHHYAGVNHFTLYNVNSMDEALRSQLEPYFKAGMVDLVEVENMLAFDFFYFGQVELWGFGGCFFGVLRLWDSNFASEEMWGEIKGM